MFCCGEKQTSVLDGGAQTRCLVCPASQEMLGTDLGPAVSPERSRRARAGKQRPKHGVFGNKPNPFNQVRHPLKFMFLQNIK